jgi:hypothetical protein
MPVDLIGASVLEAHALDMVRMLPVQLADSTRQAVIPSSGSRSMMRGLALWRLRTPDLIAIAHLPLLPRLTQDRDCPVPELKYG